MPGGSVPGRRGLLFLALLTFLFHVAVTGAHLQSPDEELMFRMAESLAVRGNLAVQPLEYDPVSRRLLCPPDATFASAPGPDGRYYAQYLPLQPVLTVPLVWLGRALAPSLAASFQRTLVPGPRHPLGEPGDDFCRAIVVALFNPIVAALSVLVLGRLGTLLTGRRGAGLLAAAGWGFGTMAWPHSRTYFTEPLAGLCALVAFDSLVRWSLAPAGEAHRPRRLRLATMLALALAAGVWTRVDFPLIAAGAGLAMVLVGEWNRRRDSALGTAPGRLPWEEYLLAGLPVAIAWGCLALLNRSHFGAEGTLTSGYHHQQEGVKFGSVLTGLWGFLFSPGKAVWLFSPILVAAAMGWRRLPRPLGTVGLMALVMYLPFVVAMMAWQNWEGGWCWGPRHITQVHLPLLLGLAWLDPLSGGILRRALWKVLFVVSAVVQLFGSTQAPMDYYATMFSVDGTPRFYSSYRELELAAMAPHVQVVAQGPEGAVATDARFLPPPMVDSLYVPHLTPWAAYPAMLRAGLCDIWLFNQFRRSESAG